MPNVPDSLWNNIETTLATTYSDARMATEFYKKHYMFDSRKHQYISQEVFEEAIFQIKHSINNGPLNLEHVIHMMCVAHQALDITMEDFFVLLEIQVEICVERDIEYESLAEGHVKGFLQRFDSDLRCFIDEVKLKTAGLNLDKETKAVIFSDSRILAAYIHNYIMGEKNFNEFILMPISWYGKHHYTRDYMGERANSEENTYLRARTLQNTSNHSLIEEKRQLAELAKRAAPVKPAPKPVKKQGFLRKFFS